MLKWIDEALIRITQKICDVLQQHTGLTKFWIEKWFFLLTILFLFSMPMLENNYVLVFILFFLCTPPTLNELRRIERAKLRFLEKGILTQTAFYIITIRYLMLLGFSLDPLLVYFLKKEFLIMALLFAVSGIFWNYFSICVPQPPSKSNLRKLYEKALWWFGDLLAPSPKPICIPGK